MRNYQKYPSSYRYIYRMGLENEFIARDVRKNIPRSTVHAWRKSNIDDARHHLNLDERVISTLSRVTEEEIHFKRQRKLLASRSLRIARIIKDQMGDRNYKKFLSEYKELLVQLIEDHEDFIG